MEVIKSYTGIWHCPVFGEFTVTVKETISLVRCDELYIVMRVSDTCDIDDAVPINPKYTRNYTEALDWYEEWNRELMRHMANT
jgi:hypothetical protein